LKWLRPVFFTRYTTIARVAARFYWAALPVLALGWSLAGCNPAYNSVQPAPPPPSQPSAATADAKPGDPLPSEPETVPPMPDQKPAQFTREPASNTTGGAGTNPSANAVGAEDPQPPAGAGQPRTTALAPAGGQNEGPQLIPRQILFGNPERAQARISPDGKRLSFLAPVDGVLNVWVGPLDDPSAAKPVTKDAKRGIRSHFWAYTSEHLLYVQDSDGDENWHVYVVDLQSGQITDLTPLGKIAAQIDSVSHRFPDEILVAINDRDESLHDLYKINLRTGDRQLLQQNPGFAGFLSDDDYRVRFAFKFTPDGGNLVLKPDGQGGWVDFLKIDHEDTLTTNPLGFDKTGDVLYLIDSRGRDTGAMTTVNLRTGEQKVLAENDKADIGGAFMHPTENTIRAVSFEYLRDQWQILDPAIESDFEYLRTVADGDIEIPSMTLDDRQWIVAYLMDNGPVRYYHYDRPKKQARFLFTNQPALEGLPLVKMHPLIIPARDGLEMVGYLSLPRDADTDGDGRPEKPLPMVLTVHGGPWARDSWGFHPEHQWLANRGYAVLSVNFRGSTGLGKRFLNAGNKEWAGKMHTDLLDAVAWAIEQKIALRDRVAIMGGSYGGYATLAGLTLSPETFRCGVDIVGPSNLLTLLSTVPPYWKPVLQMFKDRVGDPDTPEGRKLLERSSPLTNVDRIARPLLIAQGANDPRVKQSESDQIVKAMQARNIPVCYVLFPDEGHGFARPENRMAFQAVTEAFLAEYLGGRFEEIGDDFRGAEITVPTGADQVPGLPEALQGKGELKESKQEP
jgi:dipeptidyl aminopeptidase/acylaminoacyl peptidase